jgi:hypothetical protein
MELIYIAKPLHECSEESFSMLVTFRGGLECGSGVDFMIHIYLDSGRAMVKIKEPTAWR